LGDRLSEGVHIVVQDIILMLIAFVVGWLVSGWLTGRWSLGGGSNIEVEQLQGRLRQTDRELVTLKAERTELDNRLSAMASEVVVAGDQVESARAEVTDLERLSELEGKRSSTLETELGVAHEKLTAARSELTAAEYRIVELAAEVAGSNDRVTAAESEAREAQDKVVGLESNVADLQSNVVDLEGTVAELNGTIADLGVQIERADAKALRLEAELASARSDLTGMADLRTEAHQIHDRLGVAEVGLGEERSRASRLSADLEFERARRMELDTRVVGAEARSAVADEERGRASRLSMDLESERARAIELDDQLAMARAESARLQDELATAQTRFSEIPAVDEPLIDASGVESAEPEVDGFLSAPAVEVHEPTSGVFDLPVEPELNAFATEPVVEGFVEQEPVVDEGFVAEPVVDGFVEQAPVEGFVGQTPVVDEGFAAEPVVEEGFVESQPVVEGFVESPPVVDQGFVAEPGRGVVDHGWASGIDLGAGLVGEVADQADGGSTEPVVDQGFVDPSPVVDGFVEQAPVVDGFVEQAPVVEGFVESPPVVDQGYVAEPGRGVVDHGWASGIDLGAGSVGEVVDQADGGSAVTDGLPSAAAVDEADGQQDIDSEPSVDPSPAAELSSEGTEVSQRGVVDHGWAAGIDSGSATPAENDVAQQELPDPDPATSSSVAKRLRRPNRPFWASGASFSSLADRALSAVGVGSEEEEEQEEPVAVPADQQPPPLAASPSLTTMQAELDALEPDIRAALPFDTTSWALNDKARATLDRVADVLHNYPDSVVEVACHTDNTRASHLNQYLSQTWADSLVDYLTRKGGVDQARLRARGVGEAEPIDSNDTFTGRRRNRRIELVALESFPAAD
jgi:outer membrane protein OmpA-like peptidoglycan-associated protein/predicted  nucleic acid-binding Zn-ribbon protein